MLPEIVDALTSKGLIYTPEIVEFEEAGKIRRMPFQLDRLKELFVMWKNSNQSRLVTFQRRRPVKVWVDVVDHGDNFSSVGMSVQRDYLYTEGRVEELLEILRRLYHLLHPMYGEVRVFETVRKFNASSGKMILGTNLKRAMPDIYWANFLGPEYVEMFGPDRVNSTPCHSIERFQDGGVLLLLSSSPLDYFEDPEEFEKRRLDIKRHLGEDAFDTWPERQGRIPKFRYLEERGSIAPKSPSKWKDPLSHVTRIDWENWINDCSSLASALVNEMNVKGITLDFSSESLKALDNFVAATRATKAAMSMDLLKKIAAYVAVVIMKHTGASWSFEESADIPLLRLGKIDVSPLARAQKALSEGETFEGWYRFLTERLIPFGKI